MILPAIYMRILSKASLSHTNFKMATFALWAVTDLIKLEHLNFLDCGN